MKLKRLRSIDKEQQNEAHYEDESFDMSGSTLLNERENTSPDKNILIEDQTTKEQITNEDQMPTEELPNIDSQSAIHQMRQELEEYKFSNQQLQSQLQEAKMLQARTTITKEQLQEDEDMVTYYTGLPNLGTLTLVFELTEKVIPNSKEHGNRKLTNFEEFLLVMIKLQLNLQNKDLGYRFKISKSSVS